MLPVKLLPPPSLPPTPSSSALPDLLRSESNGLERHVSWPFSRHLRVSHLFQHMPCFVCLFRMQPWEMCICSLSPSQAVCGVCETDRRGEKQTFFVPYRVCWMRVSFVRWQHALNQAFHSLHCLVLHVRTIEFYQWDAIMWPAFSILWLCPPGIKTLCGLSHSARKASLPLATERFWPERTAIQYCRCDLYSAWVTHVCQKLPVTRLQVQTEHMFLPIQAKSAENNRCAANEGTPPAQDVRWREKNSQRVRQWGYSLWVCVEGVSVGGVLCLCQVREVNTGAGSLVSLTALSPR